MEHLHTRVWFFPCKLDIIQVVNIDIDLFEAINDCVKSLGISIFINIVV